MSKRDMLPEYPDDEGFEHCEQCGSRLRFDSRTRKLYCPDCDLDRRAEEEMETEGRMHP